MTGIEPSTRAPVTRRRGWLTRRLLLVADLSGLITAFAVSEWIWGYGIQPAWWRYDRVGLESEVLVFLATLPVWIIVARLYNLYRQDEERTVHSTADDLVPVFHMVTVGVWLFLGGAWLTKLARPEFPKLFTFWLLAIVLVTGGRAISRAVSRRDSSYAQNVVVVGTGPLGQLVARQLLRHPEYGLRLVGFAGSEASDANGRLAGLPVLGKAEDLPGLVRRLDIERVIVASPSEDDRAVVELIHRLKPLDVLIDIVPRYFETIQPGLAISALGGIPVLGLPPARMSRSSRAAKRAIDVVIATVLLGFVLPLLPIIAWLVKRDSPGPILFRQERLGLGMRHFTILKFRTMTVGVDDAEHRAYIQASMSPSAAPLVNGMHKLDRAEVTRVGRWLRRTSLDELPQLFNVLRGDMSLVGPRPCLPYEVENFKPHHFERFLVPPGLTGLWQVTSRARSTFGEALELDVAYARGWSLSLDLWLLCRTPLQILSSRGAA